MKPLNILMVLDSLEIGGTETHVLEISKALQARGHKIVIGTSGVASLKDFNKLV